MTKLLVELLAVDSRKFKDYIDRLEHVCMRPGVDVRLGAEILTRSRDKITELGLDVTDTTAEELFFALKHKLARDEQTVKQQLGIKNAKASNHKNLEHIASVIERLSAREKSLSLTSAGVKRILNAVPPKRTMKALKFRSLESVMKRHDPKVLYALACMVESGSWHAQVHAKIRRLNARDIQWQSISCSVVPEQWYTRLKDVLSDNGALHANNELGIVCVLPVVDTTHVGATVLLLGMGLQAASSIAIQSLPYKKLSLSQGFETIVTTIASGSVPKLSSIHGLTPSWRAVYELLGKRHVSLMHDDVEFAVFDLFWESTETKLASIDSQMDFWVDTHYLGAHASLKPVSFHVLDVAISLLGNVEYGRHANIHLESSLWNELQIRYLREEVLSRTLVSQLSKATDDMIL